MRNIQHSLVVCTEYCNLLPHSQQACIVYDATQKEVCCREIGIMPKPPAAVIPLGTGNGMSVNLGWGHKASKNWVKDRESMSGVSSSPSAYLPTINPAA